MGSGTRRGSPRRHACTGRRSETEMLEAVARVFEVDIATSKATCIDLLRANEFDVLMASERLNDGSGLELLSQVGQRWPNVVRILAIEPERRAMLKGKLAPSNSSTPSRTPWRRRTFRVCSNGLPILRARRRGGSGTSAATGSCRGIRAVTRHSVAAAVFQYPRASSPPGRPTAPTAPLPVVRADRLTPIRHRPLPSHVSMRNHVPLGAPEAASSGRHPPARKSRQSTIRLIVAGEADDKKTRMTLKEHQTMTTAVSATVTR